MHRSRWVQQIFCNPSISVNVSVLRGGWTTVRLSRSGMFAIRAERDYVIEEDFFKAARKIAENKKLESKLDYESV